MSHALPFAAIALLVALPLAGCIGDENLDPASEGLPLDVDPTEAIVHTTAAPGDEPMFIGGATVLPVGVPLPTGVMRETSIDTFEPTIGATSGGVLFMSSFDYPGPTEYLGVQRSLDQGLTWEDVMPRAGPVTLPPDSNDPYVYVDPDTDRVFMSNLHALVCSSLAFSDDDGESWTFNPLGCGHPVGVHDHQTVFAAAPRTVTTVGYDKVVYYCVNRVVDSACATSLNGGLTFGPLRPLVFPGIDPMAGLGLEGFCGGLHAHGTAAPDGTVYLPKGQCGVPSVAISQDDGLTWEVVAISETVPILGHEVNVAIDEVGHAYAVWTSDDRLPYFAASKDGGFTWNEPVMIAAPGVLTTSHVTLAAGADGRVAIAYVGTDAQKPYDEMESDDKWNAYVTVMTNALDAAPIAMTVTANDPSDPIARGVCGGTRCFGTEGGAIGDFIDIIIDPAGRPFAAFVDVCTGSCRESGGEENDMGVSFVGTLGEGPALRGELVALPPLASVANAPAEE